MNVIHDLREGAIPLHSALSGVAPKGGTIGSANEVGCDVDIVGLTIDREPFLPEKDIGGIKAERGEITTVAVLDHHTTKNVMFFYPGPLIQI